MGSLARNSLCHCVCYCYFYCPTFDIEAKQCLTATCDHSVCRYGKRRTTLLSSRARAHDQKTPRAQRQGRADHPERRRETGRGRFVRMGERVASSWIALFSGYICGVATTPANAMPSAAGWRGGRCQQSSCGRSSQTAHVLVRARSSRNSSSLAIAGVTHSFTGADALDFFRSVATTHSLTGARPVVSRFMPVVTATSSILRHWICHGAD